MSNFSHRWSIPVGRVGRERGNSLSLRSVSLLVSVVALVAPVLLVLGGSPARAAGIQPYRYLSAQVFTSPGLGAVAVGMPNKRTVKIQHLDPATGTWDSPSVLYRKKGVTCGEIDGRSSPGGVALLLECDTPYYEDQAPVHSVALVSRDLRGWAKLRLPGEAYKTPAISPSGGFAAWLTGDSGDYLLWSAQGGFAPVASTTYDYDGYGETPVVDDAGTVSVLGPENRGRACVIGVHTRDLAGSQSHSVVEGVDPGCTEGGLKNVDVLTVTGGYERADRFTLSRPAVGSPWTLTRIRPSDAPGLVSYGGSRQQIATAYVDTVHTERPLVAIGSPDRRRVLTQVYDDTTSTWGPQTEIYKSRGRCRDAGNFSDEPRELYVFELRCGAKKTLLASADGRSWTVGRLGRHPWTLAGDQVALPGAHGTVVVSSQGVTRFPGTAAGRCSVVYPGEPGTLVRLHSKPGANWPTQVQVSTGGAFRTVSRAPRTSDTCRRAYVNNEVDPPVVILQGRANHQAMFRKRHGTWILTYPTNPYP